MGLFKRKNSGFTLIEILLVIAILAILAGVVVVALNPAKQFGEAQDSQRRSDVRTILDGIQQYAIDNNGLYPDTIPIGGTCMINGLPICRYGVPCDGVDLDVIADNQTYLADIPTDPVDATGNSTGYYVVMTDDERISVCAPFAYGAEQIVLTQ